ncbi:MAG: hypothetical protein ACLUE1_04735 [Adlercreutzia equolifaciens]
MLKVGAATESDEGEEVPHRRLALRAAVEEGIVAGGGVALVDAIGALTPSRRRQGRGSRHRHHPQGRRGPMRAIAQNAGFEGSVVVENAACRRARAELRQRRVRQRSRCGE